MIKSETKFLKKLINKYTKEEFFEKRYPLTSNPFELIYEGELLRENV